MCLLSAGNCKEEGVSIPLVEALSSLAHPDPRYVVTLSPSHVSVLATLDFLMDTLIFKSPETIIIYNHSM